MRINNYLKRNHKTQLKSNYQYEYVKAEPRIAPKMCKVETIIRKNITKYGQFLPEQIDS